MDQKAFDAMIDGIIKEIEEDSRPLSSELPAAARQRSRSRPRPRPRPPPPQPDPDPYAWTEDELTAFRRKPEPMLRPFDENPWREFEE